METIQEHQGFHSHPSTEPIHVYSHPTERLVQASDPQRGQFPTHRGAVAEPDQLSAKRAVATAKGDPLNKGKDEAISTKKTLDFFAQSAEL